jgi:hypothetical protein
LIQSACLQALIEQWIGDMGMSEQAQSRPSGPFFELYVALRALQTAAKKLQTTFTSDPVTIDLPPRHKLASYEARVKRAMKPAFAHSVSAYDQPLAVAQQLLGDEDTLTELHPDWASDPVLWGGQRGDVDPEAPEESDTEVFESERSGSDAVPEAAGASASQTPPDGDDPADSDFEILEDADAPGQPAAAQAGKPGPPADQARRSGRTRAGARAAADHSAIAVPAGTVCKLPEACAHALGPALVMGKSSAAMMKPCLQYFVSSPLQHRTSLDGWPGTALTARSGAGACASPGVPFKGFSLIRTPEAGAAQEGAAAGPQGAAGLAAGATDADLGSEGGGAAGSQGLEDDAAATPPRLAHKRALDDDDSDDDFHELMSGQRTMRQSLGDSDEE